MAAAKYDITIEQGATFSLPLVIKNSDGTYFDLTNWVPRGQIRKYVKSTIVIIGFSFSIIDAVGGSMVVSLTAAQTATISSGSVSTDAQSKYVYDVELVYTSGEPVKRLLQGTVYISPEVTR